MSSRGVEWYSSLFGRKCSNGASYMDASPSYFDLPVRIHGLYNLAPRGVLAHLRVILILREPVSRELSWWNHLRDVAVNRMHSDASFVEVDYHHESGARPAVRDIGMPWAWGRCSFTDYVQGKVVPRLRALFNYNASSPQSPAAADVQSAERSAIWKVSDEDSLDTNGAYSVALRLWFTLFSRRHVLVLNKDELDAEPEKLVRRLGDFIEAIEFEDGRPPPPPPLPENKQKEEEEEEKKKKKKKKKSKGDAAEKTRPEGDSKRGITKEKIPGNNPWRMKAMARKAKERKAEQEKEALAASNGNNDHRKITTIQDQLPSLAQERKRRRRRRTRRRRTTSSSKSSVKKVKQLNIKKLNAHDSELKVPFPPCLVRDMLQSLFYDHFNEQLYELMRQTADHRPRAEAFPWAPFRQGPCLAPNGTQIGDVVVQAAFEPTREEAPPTTTDNHADAAQEATLANSTGFRIDEADSRDDVGVSNERLVDKRDTSGGAVNVSTGTTTSAALAVATPGHRDDDHGDGDDSGATSILTIPSGRSGDDDDHDDHDDNSRLQFAKVVEGSTVIGSSVSTPKVKPSSSPVHTFLSAGALLVLAPFFVGILCMLGYVLGLVAFKRTSSLINTIMRAARMIKDNLVFGAVEESSEDERAEGLLGGGHADNAIELTELRDRTVLSFESIEAESSSSSEDDAGEV
jgi:hypothetical protein